MAMFPLPYVGREHADGHLMGIALALPTPQETGADAAEIRRLWRRAMAALLDENGELELSPAHRSWTMRLAPEESADPPQALQPNRWIRRASVWQTVTPIVLDRHPKPHFKKDPLAWQESCAAIVRTACVRIGLPEPSVAVSLYSSLKGVPPAAGFPAPVSRSGRPPRFHVHARLEFDQPVSGPLLLGAGRFRGYGLCLPVSEKTSRTMP